MCLFTGFTFDGPIIPNLRQYLAYFVSTFSSSDNRTLISTTRSSASTIMRQDRTFARILLIYSVANVAIAAPAAVRQRHLDVTKAALEKRAPPDSANGETGGDFLPESSSAAVSGNGATGDPPPESSSSAANRITTQALAPGSGNGETDNLPTGSSSAPANHITTQALGASGPGNEATDNLPTGSSPAPANHITTQALGASGPGNEATDNLPPESSSSGANRISTQALGASGSGNGATDDLPPESSSAAANRITTQASKAPGLGNGETSNLPPESSSPMPPHERPMDKSKWDWLLWPDSPKASSASSGSGNGAKGDLPPDSSSRVAPHDGPTDKWAWLYHGTSPGTSFSSAPQHDYPPPNVDRTPLPESPPALSGHISTQASGSSSSSNVFNYGDLHQPPPLSPDHSPAVASEAGHAAGWHAPHVTLPGRGKLVFYSGVAVVATGIVAYAYGLHQWLKNPYVSPLSPPSPADT